MPAVLVHGVPETSSIWASLVSQLERDDVVTPQLPGFGCPRPDGFGASKDDYVAWLLGELDHLEGPIDLVGHDWGALLTYRVAAAHGDRLRSWVADIGNLAHPDYEWHGFAKLWQTPGDGEAFVESQSALTPAERAAGLVSMGVPEDDALAMAEAADATMGACILELYRSATPNVHADWGPWAATRSPGMVLQATSDPFAEAVQAAEVARTFGARFERIDGPGHFWPCQAPDQGAAILESFWASLA